MNSQSLQQSRALKRKISARKHICERKWNEGMQMMCSHTNRFIGMHVDQTSDWHTNVK